MNTFSPIFFPVYTGHGGGKLSEQDIKILLGIVIVMLFIWFCTSIYSVVKYLKREDLQCSFSDYYFDIEDFTYIFHWLMIALSAVGVIVYLGFLVSKLL